MTPTIEFDPAAFSERSLRLILAKAHEWGCEPAEAVSRLIDAIVAADAKKAEG